MVVIPIAVSLDAGGAWAYSGNGACPHDNGSFNSAGCVVGYVSTDITSQAVLSGYDGLGWYQDQIRWHTSEYGGVNSQFAEAGLIEYGTYPSNSYMDLYNAYVDGGGTVHLILADSPNCPANPSGQTFDQDINYAAAGTWDMFVTLPNTVCGLENSTGNIGIDGGGAAEAGLAFLPQGSGYWGDGTVAPYVYNVVAEITTTTAGTIEYNNYVNDAPCGSPPCLNGAFYNSSGLTGWSSNLQ